MPGEVTKENFCEKAVMFMRASGRGNGEHPVIRKTNDALAFATWVAFMRQMGGPTHYAFAEKLGVMTMPTMWPWEFSADADGLRDMSAPRVKHPIDVSSERRAELAAIIRGQLPKEMRYAGGRRRRPDYRDTAKSPSSDVVVDASPVEVSQSLRKTLYR